MSWLRTPCSDEPTGASSWRRSQKGARTREAHLYQRTAEDPARAHGPRSSYVEVTLARQLDRGGPDAAAQARLERDGRRGIRARGLSSRATSPARMGEDLGWGIELRQMEHCMAVEAALGVNPRAKVSTNCAEPKR